MRIYFIFAEMSNYFHVIIIQTDRKLFKNLNVHIVMSTTSLQYIIFSQNLKLDFQQATI